MDPQNASDPYKAIRGASEESYKILLAHQPKSIFKAADAGFDLQLSGHTHGGQFYPWNLVVGLLQPYIKGLHRYQNTDVYVCTGVENLDFINSFKVFFSLFYLRLIWFSITIRIIILKRVERKSIPKTRGLLIF